VSGLPEGLLLQAGKQISERSTESFTTCFSTGEESPQQQHLLQWFRPTELARGFQAAQCQGISATKNGGARWPLPCLAPRTFIATGWDWSRPAKQMSVNSCSSELLQSKPRTTLSRVRSAPSPMSSEPIQENAPTDTSGTTYLDAGFAVISSGPIQQWPYYEVRVLGRDVDQDNEKTRKFLTFLGDVLESEQAAKGFKLTYDLRASRIPRINLLMSIAKWGSSPQRQDIFKSQCLACCVCVTEGSKCTVAKFAMNAFFKVCPPTCTTCLVTDPDTEPMAIWDKPAPPIAAIAEEDCCMQTTDTEHPSSSKQEQSTQGNSTSSASGQGSREANRSRINDKGELNIAVASMPCEGQGLAMKPSQRCSAHWVSCFTCFDGLFHQRKGREVLEQQVLELQQQVDHMKECLSRYED